MTFSSFADQWLKNRVNIKASTWENYESYLKVHVKPEIGEMGLKDIQFPQVQRLIASLTRKNTIGERFLSANTIGKIATMLKSIFKSAVKHSLIRVNPALELELRRVIRHRTEPPAKADVVKILKQAPADVQTLFLRDAVTGLRRGEILGLQWLDIDWLNQEVLVQRAICKAKSTDTVRKYQWVAGSTKSGRSRRVGLPPIVVEALRLLRSAADPKTEDAFIFTRNGTFIDPEYFSKWIALPLVKKATEGRVKRFHNLRHFFASMLIEIGKDPKYFQDQVGHASITTTFDTYGHLMPQAKQQATAKLQKSIFGKATVERC